MLSATQRSNDWRIWLLLVAWVLAVLPRELHIAAENSPSMDAEWHLRRGLVLWSGNTTGLILRRNDPPLGQFLLTMPMVVLGCGDLGAPIDLRNWPPDYPYPGQEETDPNRARIARTARYEVLLGHKLTPETLVAAITFWKTLLMIPAIAVALLWMHEVAGWHGVWPLWLVLVGEPSWMAHIGAIALDGLGAGAAIVALYANWCWWKSAQGAAFWRWGLCTSAALACALSIKHTNVVLCVPTVVVAARWAWAGAAADSRTTHILRTAVRLAGFVLCVWGCLWVFDGFNISCPTDEALAADGAGRVWTIQVPAGRYVGCLLSAISTDRGGYNAYVLGRIIKTGTHAWWVIPVTLWFKLPWGIMTLWIAGGLVLLLRPGRCAWVLVILAILWFGLVIQGDMYHGIRHLLMPVLLISTASIITLARLPRDWGAGLALCLTLVGAAEGAWVHPYELSFFNRPAEKPWLLLADSNTDWGQQGVAARRWVKELPEPHPVIWASLRSNLSFPSVRWWLGPQVRILDARKSNPRSGWVILPPHLETGQRDDFDRYAFARPQKPIAVIANSIGVYSLDDPANQQEGAATRTSISPPLPTPASPPATNTQTHTTPPPEKPPATTTPSIQPDPGHPPP